MNPLFDTGTVIAPQFMYPLRKWEGWPKNKKVLFEVGRKDSKLLNQTGGMEQRA